MIAGVCRSGGAGGQVQFSCSELGKRLLHARQLLDSAVLSGRRSRSRIWARLRVRVGVGFEVRVRVGVGAAVGARTTISVRGRGRGRI